MNLNSGAEQADKTQQDLTTGGPWPRVSKSPATDSILRPNPPHPGVRSCRAIQRSYLTRRLRSQRSLGLDRGLMIEMIGRGELETTPGRFLGFYEAQLNLLPDCLIH